MRAVHGRVDPQTLPGFLQFDPDWTAFKTRHATWSKTRIAEGDVVYRVPASVLPTLKATLGLSDDVVEAEQAFDDLCLKSRAVGVWQDRPVPYPWLLPRFNPIPAERLQSMRNLGWTDEQIRSVPELLGKADDISHRVQSIAGRRVCNPAFLAERDELRTAWLQLADKRPPLPLRRALQVAERATWMKAIPATAVLGRFLRQFDEFCVKWDVFGMATWDLPEPLGPQWPEMRDPSTPPASIVLVTPPDFPLLSSDGIGQIARVQHTETQRVRGTADIARWQTYASLLEIDHWERVLTSRYQAHKRPPSFVTRLETMIGSAVSGDQERVQKRRKELRALKQGRRSVLSEHR